MRLIRPLANIFFALLMLASVMAAPAVAGGLADIGAAASQAVANVTAIGPPTTDFPALGAHGDASFRDVCPPAQYLIGFRVRAGSWLDQVAIICAPIGPNLTFGPKTYGPARGGNGGGGPTDFTCADGHSGVGHALVTSLLPTFTSGLQQVMTISSWCSTIDTYWPIALAVHGAGLGGDFAKNPEQVCPAGQVAVGLLGNYGKHVNAVGLICGPFALLLPTVSAMLDTGKCTAFYERWRDYQAPDATDEYKATECAAIIGINDYCAKQDSFVTVDSYANNDLIPGREQQRLVCAKNYHKASLDKEAEQLAKGVADGVVDGFIAASPYLGLAVEGLSCVQGVVYSCAVLAVDLVGKAQKAGALSGISPRILNAADIDLVATVVGSVDSCVGYDIAACLKIGQAGLRAAGGPNIPGPAALKALAAGAACADGEFAACAHLGEFAADAAGVPIGDVGGAALDAWKCLDDEDDDCSDLGREVVNTIGSAKIPGLSDGVAFAAKCSDGQSHYCELLAVEAGAMASQRLPVTNILGIGDRVNKVFDEAGALQVQAEGCAAGNADACVNVATQAAKAAGIPVGGLTDGLGLLQKCRDGDNAACVQLGKEAAGAAGIPVRLADALTAQAGPCVNSGNADACIEIGRQAARTTGVPLGDVDKLKHCAAGDMSVCSALAAGATGLPLGDPTEIASEVSRCAMVDQDACRDLGMQAVSRYDKSAMIVGIVTGKGINKGGLQVGSANSSNSWFPSPPPPPAIPTSAKPGAGVTFAGQWVTTVQNGRVHGLSLTQDGAGHVSGAYDAGSIEAGVVVGDELYARWKQGGGAAGTLLFKLAPDRATFAGLWTQGDKAPAPAEANGTWDGYRSDVFAGTAPVRGFAGTWKVTTDSLDNFTMQLQSDGGAGVFGTYGDENIAGSVRGASIDAAGKPESLVFAWNQRGARGDGLLYIYPDGSHISGLWRMPDNSIGTWSATLAPAPVMASVRPPPVAAVPVVKPPAQPVVPPADFAGDWATKTDKNWAYQLTLRQTQEGNSGEVTGTYVVQDGSTGTINGIVKGKLLTFNWTQDGGFAGTGRFTMGADNNSFAGDYLDTANPGNVLSTNLLTGTWRGTRGIVPFPPADFAGGWTTSTDKNWTYILTLQQTSAHVSGTYAATNGSKGTINGDVNGRVLSFTWTQDGGYAGTGQFTMTADNNSFNGDYMTTANPSGALSPDLLTGKWKGTRGVAQAANPLPAAGGPVQGPVDYGGCVCSDKPEVVK